jgi:cytoskeleton protein RodZ
MSDNHPSDPAASAHEPELPTTTDASAEAPSNQLAAVDSSIDLTADASVDTNVDTSVDTTPAELATADATAQAMPVQPAAADAQFAAMPGAILAKRRKEFRLSLEDVSSRLKISQRQIIALESDDFGQLASMATVRGFIRSYAKLLELDPAPLMAMLASEPNPAFDSIVVRRPLPAPGARARQTPPPRRRQSNRPWALIVVLVGLLGGLIFSAYHYEWFSPPSIDYAKVIDALPPLTGGREPAAGEVEAEKSGVASVSGSAVASASALEIKAREDSWVEVTTVEGDRRLISRLMKAGSTELIEVDEPVILVVGNAVGVDASLRGQPLNLRAVARDNVAKLSLK